MPTITLYSLPSLPLDTALLSKLASFSTRNELPEPSESQADDWSVGEESILPLRQPQSKQQHSPPPLQDSCSDTWHETILDKCQLRLYQRLSPPQITDSGVIHSAKIQHAFQPPREHLRQGRRGTWIIPIHGNLEIQGASPTIWTNPNSFIETKHQDVFPIATAIVWTEQRLKSVFQVIEKLQYNGRHGLIHAFVHRSSDCIDLVSSTTHEHVLPDHIRISVDGNFALPIRLLLGLVHAGAHTKNKDKIPVLTYSHGIRLAYLDERGRPIFLA